MNIKIYHNPRCSKSRQALSILKDKFSDIYVVRYLEDRLSTDELTRMIHKLGLSPIQLVRKNEKIWKELYKDKSLSDHQIIEAMQQHPTLMERPIVFIDEQTLLARPIEKLTKFIEQVASK